jgi:hypothetical protein
MTKQSGVQMLAPHDDTVVCNTHTKAERNLRHPGSVDVGIQVWSACFIVSQLEEKANMQMLRFGWFIYMGLGPTPSEKLQSPPIHKPVIA